MSQRGSNTRRNAARMIRSIHCRGYLVFAFTADISAFADIPTSNSADKHLVGTSSACNSPESLMLPRVGSFGMDLALSVIRMQRKEVRYMKIATSFLAALLFTGTLGALNNAIADDGIVSKDELTVG